MNTNKGLIGVIVPVYKVEKYIAECIESILAQTYTNFRLILIDDGSPDNAGKICDEYAKKDLRITVIHQENAGVTRARARGVEEAEDCEYIAFVDSDDTITTTALEELEREMNGDCDIVSIDFHNNFSHCKELPVEDYRKILITEYLFSPDPWGKLFKRKLFNKFIFDIPRNIVIAEDRIMNIRLSFNTEKNIHLLNKQIYKYREYPESTFHSHRRTPENEQDIHIHKVKSFPEAVRDKYFIQTIPPRLLRCEELWGYKYNVKGMKETIFYTELAADIKKYNYRMSYLNKIIFNYTNPMIRFIAINAKRFKNKLSQFNKSR